MILQNTSTFITSKFHVFMEFFRKFFYHENYVIGFKILKKGDLPVGEDQSPYTVLMSYGSEWYADPFPFEKNGKHYIFMEIYNIWETKAKLGYYCIEDKLSPKVVIDEPFHLSYPNIFEWKGEVYMIPETHNVRQVRLYRSTQFPDAWVLDRVLLDDRDLADTSLMFADDGIWVESMETEGTCMHNKLFKLNMDEKVMREIDPPTKEWIDKRPAGNFFKIGNRWYHALQECSRVYGEYMHLARVSEFNSEAFIEEECMQIHASNYNLDVKKPFLYTHTFNRYGNLEVIDLLYWRFNLQLFPARLYRKISRYWLKSK